MSLMFDLTPNLQRGIEIVNGIEAAKFGRILTRITAKLHLKDEAPFSPEEQAALQEALGLTADELQVALVTCSFMFQQAAYFGVKPKKFASQLVKAEVAQDKAEMFMQVWEKSGDNVVNRLQEHVLAPHRLDSVDWRLQINMSQDDAAKLKGTNALFQFNLADTVDAAASSLPVRVEFTQDQLIGFFNQLETIQEQLDAVQR